MGRPLNKSKLSGASGAFGGNLSGKIAVTAYRPFGGSKVDSTVAYLVSQRGSRTFKVHMDDSTEAVMKLMAVAPGTLAADDASGLGQFCVQVILDDSTVAYVSKFYKNVVNYVDTAGNTGRIKYTLGTEGTDEGQVASTGNIDVR
jgi:hypothetical protein